MYLFPHRYSKIAAEFIENTNEMTWHLTKLGKKIKKKKLKEETYYLVKLLPQFYDP